MDLGYGAYEPQSVRSEDAGEQESDEGVLTEVSREKPEREGGPQYDDYVAKQRERVHGFRYPAQILPLCKAKSRIQRDSAMRIRTSPSTRLTRQPLLMNTMTTTTMAHNEPSEARASTSSSTG